MPKRGDGVAVRGAWLAAVGCAALATAAALLLGAPVTAVLLMILPMAAEVLREAGRPWTAALTAAGLGAAAWFTLPAMIAPLALAWCAASMLMAWLPMQRPVYRSILWGAMASGIICGALVILGAHYPGSIVEGLAGDAAKWIDGRKDAASILLRAYQSGLAGLEENLAIMPVLPTLGGGFIMPDNVRVELLKGLRTTIALLLQSYLPGVMVGWIGLTGLLCAVLPDAYRRRHGKPGRLPAFGMWRLPEEMNALTLLLILSSWIGSMSASRVTAQACAMCGAAFQDIYLVLGMCAGSCLMRRQGTGRGARFGVLALGAVLLPTVLVILGVADQAFDLRGLRHSTDE